MNLTHLVDIVIKAQDSASKELSKIAGRLGEVETAAVLASGAIATAATSISVLFVKTAAAGARFANELDSISQKTLVSVDTITAIGLTIEKSGGEFRDAQMPIRRFGQAVVDLVGGNRELEQAFARVGITAKDVIGPGGTLLGFEQLLPQIADGFSSITDSSTAADVATALFGRSGISLLPVLMDGSSGLARMTSEARNLGLIMGDEVVDNVADFADAIIELQLSFKALQVGIANGLVPSLKTYTRLISSAVGFTANFAREHPQVAKYAQEFANLTSVVASAVIGFSSLRWIAMKLKPIITSKMSWGGGLVTAGVLLVLQQLLDSLGEIKGKYKELEEAKRGADASLQNNASIEEEIAALERLRAAQIKVFEMRAKTSGGGGGMYRYGIGPSAAAAARRDAVAQWEQSDEARRLEALRKTQWRRGKMAAGFEQDRADAIVIPFKATIDVEPLDVSSLKKRIEVQRGIVAQAEADATRAAERLAERAELPEGHEDRVKFEREKAEAENAATIAAERLDAMQRKLIESTREVKEESREVALALIDMAAESGDLPLEKAFALTQKKVAEANAELDKAEEAYNNTTVGAEGYTDALNNLQSALTVFSQATSLQKRLGDEISQRHKREKDDLEELEKATRELAVAQEQLAIVSSGDKMKKGEARAKAEAQNIAALREEYYRMRAAFENQPNVPEVMTSYAEATDAYAKALIDLRNGFDAAGEGGFKLTMMMGAISSVTSAMLDAITGATVNMGSVVKSILLGIVNALIQIKLQAILVRKFMSAISGAAAFTPAGFIGLASSFMGAATGGEIVKGVRGLDTVPILAQRGENVLDASLNDRLRRFLSSAATGTYGGVALQQTVNINAGMMLGSEQDALQMASKVIQRTDEFTRQHIARMTLQDT